MPGYGGDGAPGSRRAAEDGKDPERGGGGTVTTAGGRRARPGGLPRRLWGAREQLNSAIDRDDCTGASRVQAHKA